MLPPMTESHVHLDAAMTAVEPRFNKSGTLFEGIEIWAERKKSLTKEDVKQRAGRAIREEMRHGMQYIRTHVDVCDRKLTALEALPELRQEIKDKITLQIIAFPQECILSYNGAKQLMKKATDADFVVLDAKNYYEAVRDRSTVSYSFRKGKILYDASADVRNDYTGAKRLFQLTAEKLSYFIPIRVLIYAQM